MKKFRKIRILDLHVWSHPLAWANQNHAECTEHVQPLVMMMICRLYANRRRHAAAASWQPHYEPKPSCHRKHVTLWPWPWPWPLHGAVCDQEVNWQAVCNYSHLPPVRVSCEAEQSRQNSHKDCTKWNEIALILSAFENRLRVGLVYNTSCKQIQPLSRIKTLNGPRVRGISSVVEEPVYGGKDLPKSQVLSSEWKTERVRDDESGESEDGEDDELPCVIGENELKGLP